MRIISGVLIVVSCLLVSHARASAAERVCNRDAATQLPRISITVPYGLAPKKPVTGLFLTIDPDGNVGRDEVVISSGDEAMDASVRQEVGRLFHVEPAARDCVAYETGPYRFTVTVANYKSGMAPDSPPPDDRVCAAIPMIARLAQPLPQSDPIRAGKTGTVSVKLTFDGDVNVVKASVDTSSGDAGLDAEAVRILSHSTFVDQGTCFPVKQILTEITTSLRFY
jgi:TonB family protein